MEAGIEMENIVVDKIMKWPYTPLDEMGVHGRYWTTDSGERYKAVYPPEFSTDMTHVMKVIEKLRDTHSININDGVYLDVGAGRSWTVSLVPVNHDGDGKTFTATSESLPHAICLAALKSVGAIN